MINALSTLRQHHPKQHHHCDLLLLGTAACVKQKISLQSTFHESPLDYKLTTCNTTTHKVRVTKKMDGLMTKNMQTYNRNRSNVKLYVITAGTYQKKKKKVFGCQEMQLKRHGKTKGTTTGLT